MVKALYAVAQGKHSVARKAMKSLGLDELEHFEHILLRAYGKYGAEMIQGYKPINQKKALEAEWDRYSGEVQAGNDNPQVKVYGRGLLKKMYLKGYINQKQMNDYARLLIDPK